MHRKHIIITGLLGWLGGLATATLGTSCDTECPTTPSASLVINFVTQDGSAFTAASADKVTYTFVDEAEPGGGITAPGEERNGICLDEGCTQWVASAGSPGTFDVTAELCGQTYTKRVVVEAGVDDCWSTTAYTPIEVDTSACPLDPPVTTRSPDCDRSAHPSVLVNVSKIAGGDMAVNVTPREGVWFEHDGVRHEASCLPGPNNTCVSYMAGLELSGRILIGTDYCDQTFTEAVSVDMTADGCHVETEHVSLVVNDTGCLADAPEGPDDLDLSNRPQEGDDPDVTNPTPDPDPPGDPGDVTNKQGRQGSHGQPGVGNGDGSHPDPDPNGPDITNRDGGDPDPVPPPR